MRIIDEQNKASLNEIETLTLYRGKLTNARRLEPMKQLMVTDDFQYIILKYRGTTIGDNKYFPFCLEISEISIRKLQE